MATNHLESNGSFLSSSANHMFTESMKKYIPHSEDLINEFSCLNQLNAAHEMNDLGETTSSLVISQPLPPVENDTLYIASFLTNTSLDTKLARKQFVQKVISSEYVDEYVPEHENGPDYIIPSSVSRSCQPEEAVTIPISKEGVASSEAISVVTYLRRLKTEYPSAIALEVERGNVLLQWTYVDFWNDVCSIAKAFLKLGLERFHAVGILGFNSPEWTISNFASIFAGGLSSGIYATNSPEACAQVLSDSSANIIVLENDLQLKKILEVREKLPQLKAIVQYIGEPSTSGVLSWNDLLEIGRNSPDEILERRFKGLAVNQCCTLIYTSGTTGLPSGVMLNHDNITYICQRYQDYNHTRKGEEIFLSFLPLSHMAPQIFEYITLGFGSKIHYPPPDAVKEHLVDTLKKVKPTFIFGVPRVWERISEKIRDAERELSPFKRALFRWANTQAIHYNRARKEDSDSTTLLFSLAKRLVLKKIQKSLGLDRIVVIMCAAAPLNPEILQHFISLNLPITECYGLSETAGPHTYNYGLPMKLGSVGTPFPSLEIKIDHPDEHGNGEIWLKGRNIFMGYLRNEDKTKEAVDDDGWLHTGDVGFLTPDKYLYITGRIKEILITSGGENVAPKPIEERLKQMLPIVSNCMLIGDRRKYLSVLITLKTGMDMNTLIPDDNLRPVAINWCKSIGSNAERIQDILIGPDPKVIKAIQEGIDQVNQSATSNAQRIRKWVILSRDFSIGGGELGPTMKLKRPAVLKIHSEAIESMYAE